MKFYEIDLSNVGGGVIYFHPGLNEFGKPVVWGGREYHPFPIAIEGLEYDGQGRLPRPTLTVSNVNGELGRLVRQHKDLNGCLLVHRMTLSDFLDAENFTNGNPDANPNLEFPKEIYIFERKAEETPEYVRFDLASALDLEGQMLPKRVYNANYCPHAYGGPLCGATAPGPCARNIAACEAIFGAGAKLPFGGFPGVGLVGR
jgi:lambda family phage minor tail protein L